MILAVLIFGLALPHHGYCRPLIEEEEDMDNAIEPDSSRKNEVQDWVKITKAPPQKVIQKLGESVEVECEIMGSPAPFVEWFEGRYPSDNEVSLLLSFYSLPLHDLYDAIIHIYCLDFVSIFT